MRTATSPDGRHDELATPLHAVTFVVVDLETTGGSPRDCAITEVGAVKIRGGEVVGEFETLVDPGSTVPASIAALTGITDGLLAGRPPIESVLPTFLEFCRGATLVAHNARFDTGFLDAALSRLGYPRLGNTVVCTAALARRLVRDEVRDVRLATLARFFRCRTVPVHRALADARATVEVFHGLLERAGPFGVATLEDLVGFARVRDTPLYRARRPLADGLPHAPGVYAFRSAAGEVLYVGTATDLRSRVLSYFGGDPRRKVVDLLKESAALDHVVCPTPIEAAVREVRLIAAHRPRYNRRSKTPERGVYLALTGERYPRLSIVRRAHRGHLATLGPLWSRRAAEQVADALAEVAPMRRCTVRMSGGTRLPACALKELGRCLAPCDGTVDQDGYAPAVAAVAAAMTGDPAAAVAAIESRMRRAAADGRYERARDLRDRLRALVLAADRTRRLARLVVVEELVVSRPARDGRRELVLVRAGRLAATSTCAPPDLARAVVELGPDPPGTGLAVDLGPGADAGAGDPGQPAPREAADELALVDRWLGGPGAAVHSCTGTFASTVAGGAVLGPQARRLGAVRSSTGRPDAELAAKRTRRAGGADDGEPG